MTEHAQELAEGNMHRPMYLGQAEKGPCEEQKPDIGYLQNRYDEEARTEEGYSPWTMGQTF